MQILKYGHLAVPILPEITSGIIRCDIRFSNSEQFDGRAVGIIPSKLKVQYPMYALDR